MHFDIFILFLFFIFLFFFEVANNSCSTSQPHQPLGNSPSILMCTTPIVFEIMAKNKIMTINVNHESKGGWRKDMIKGGFFFIVLCSFSDRTFLKGQTIIFWLWKGIHSGCSSNQSRAG